MAVNPQVGDLTKMAKEIEKVIKRHLHLKERPAICIAFTCELTDFEEAHYVLNIPRTDAVKILRMTADKLVIKSN